MKFAGVDTINDAEKLARAELQVARSQRAELEPGAAYISDLTGCRVMAAINNEPATEIGIIQDVILGAGSAPLLVISQTIGERSRELMIPFAEEYIRSLDVHHKLLELAVPEGMLELDAPLSREEKEDQHRGG
jgi:16S rRNA processing protein RimM